MFSRLLLVGGIRGAPSSLVPSFSLLLLFFLACSEVFLEVLTSPCIMEQVQAVGSDSLALELCHNTFKHRKVSSAGIF